MTNLEWIRTLSAEELADWFYNQWLHRLQYRWSSSEGGLVVWLNEQRAEQTEPQTEPLQTCSVNGRPYDCGNCEYHKCTADEPQTERGE